MANLISAVLKENIQEVRRLLETGVDIESKDSRENTPLHYASAIGSAALCELLIQSGANLESRDELGETPLHHASKYGQSIICELLVKSGANLEAEDEFGETPLFEATRRINLDVIYVLLDLGADPLHKNTKGKTPIDIAKPELKSIFQRVRQKKDFKQAQGLATLAAASEFPNLRPGQIPLPELPDNVMNRVAGFLNLQKNRIKTKKREKNLTRARKAVAEQHAAKVSEQQSKAAKEGWYGFMGGKRRKTRAKKTKRRKQTKRQR
jgi:hypothetical protein